MNHFDLAFLKEITNGNKDKLHLFINTFILSAPAVITNLRNLNTEKKYDLVKSEAHSAKPLFNSIGNLSTVRILDRIENYSTNPLLHELISVELDYLSEITEDVCTNLRKLI
jgi:HPt (histidine-containing phosphotransfer) domain-containing protein